MQVSGDSSSPVSCSRNRRRFVGQALWCFLRQQYDPCEMIVVDDGANPVADLIRADPHIRYVRRDTPLPAGARPCTAKSTSGALEELRGRR